MAAVMVPWQSIGLFLLALSSLVLYNEFLVYYLVLLKCTWPILNTDKADSSLPPTQSQPVKAMVIADTHLLGTREGHWFDKLRR